MCGIFIRYSIDSYYLVLKALWGVIRALPNAPLYVIFWFFRSLLNTHSHTRASTHTYINVCMNIYTCMQKHTSHKYNHTLLHLCCQMHRHCLSWYFAIITHGWSWSINRMKHSPGAIFLLTFLICTFNHRCALSTENKLSFEVYCHVQNSLKLEHIPSHMNPVHTLKFCWNYPTFRIVHFL